MSGKETVCYLFVPTVSVETQRRDALRPLSSCKSPDALCLPRRGAWEREKLNLPHNCWNHTTHSHAISRLETRHHSINDLTAGVDLVQFLYQPEDGLASLFGNLLKKDVYLWVVAQFDQFLVELYLKGFLPHCFVQHGAGISARVGASKIIEIHRVTPFGELVTYPPVQPEPL